MKTVITYGIFDLFHEGHVRLLERAKALGDRLIVGVCTDQYAYERGKFTVVDSLETRLKHVMACPAVDQVIIEDHFGQKVEDIARYHADIFAIGDDWLGKFDHLNKLCHVVYLPRTPGVSSSLLRAQRYSTLRLGVIGCGRIVERFLQEAFHVHDIRVVSFFHPRPDSSASAAAFRQRHPDITLSRTPEKLFDQVDAVYVAAPHSSHARYTRAALEAGRHVLCEKPLSFDGEEAEALFSLAKRQGLVLMEGIKTAYCPGFLELISLCRSGMIGEIRDIDASFTRLTAPGLREWTDREYGGSFAEFGSYVLLPVVKLFGDSVMDWSFHSIWEDGVDAFTRFLAVGDGISASGKTGIGVKTHGELVISGTKGYLTACPPWWKTTGFEFNYEDPKQIKRYVSSFEGDGLRYEIADFLYRVRGYEGREYKLLPEESIRIAEVYGRFQKGRVRG